MLFKFNRKKCVKCDYNNKITVVYGCSDDLVEIDGEIIEEFGVAYRKECILVFSDNTKLKIYYCKEKDGSTYGIWGIDVVEEGKLFERKVECWDEDADLYSDIVFFKEGIKTVDRIK